MSYNFISTGEYYSHGRGSTAHAIKAGNLKSIDKAAKIMAEYVLPEMILVPMANHVGYATYTKTLADEIAKLSGAQVLDVMKGRIRNTFYDIKAGGGSVNKEQLGLYLSGEIPKDKQILIIDNVISTGTTAAAAIDLIPNSIMFAYAEVGKAAKIEGLQNITQQYLSINKIKIMDNGLEKLQWFETYQQAQQKKQYEKATEAYQDLPGIRKLFTAAPQDPNPEMSSENLAQKYVQQFNAANDIGQRKDFPNGESLQIKMSYNADLQPVLQMTYYDGSTAFQENKSFAPDGSKRDLPIEYPISEFGVTGRQKDLSNSANRETIERGYALYDKLTEVIGQSLQMGKAVSIKSVEEPSEKTISKLESYRYGETSVTPAKDKELFNFIERHLQNDKRHDGLYVFITNQNDQDGLHVESFYKQGKEAIRNNDETFVPFWKLQPEKVYALSIETQFVEHLKQGEETAPVDDRHLFLTKNAAKGFYQDSKEDFDRDNIKIGRIISGKIEDKALVNDNDTIASFLKTALAYVDGNVSQKEQLDIVRHEGWHINNALAENIFKGYVTVNDPTFELLPKLSSANADDYYAKIFQAGRNEISIKELAEELHFTCDTKDKLGLKELTYRLHTENDNPAELAEPAYLVEQNFTLKINEPYNAKINSFDLQVDKIINDNHFSTIEKKGNSVDDFIQLMVNYGSYEAVKAIEMRRPEIETKRIFDYETASILHRTSLQSDFAEKYGFSHETMQAFSKHMDAAIDTQNPNAGLYVSFPYVEVNKDYNLEGHKYVTFGGVDSDRNYKSDMVDKTNLTITSEFYSKNGNAVDGSINTIAKNASVWLATNAEKGNDVNTIIFTNSAVEAMSVAEMKNVDLNHTAIVSVGKLAKEEQIKGVLELFPKAEIHTAYKNSLFGELSAIRTAAAINNTDAKISITDDNKIRIVSNGKTDVLTAQKGMAEKYIMAHNLAEKLPTQNIHRPNGHTFNDDLHSKQIKNHVQQTEKDNQTKSYKLKI